jgi:bifunctional polynucleotide phosphatase/kinase
MRGCLHGIHLTPTASSRVAAFDLDGTVIKSQFIQVGTRKGSKGGSGGGKRVMKKQANGLEWEWWKAVVPHKLKEVRDSGYAHLSRPFFLDVCFS